MSDEPQKAAVPPGGPGQVAPGKTTAKRTARSATRAAAVEVAKRKGAAAVPLAQIHAPKRVPTTKG